MLETVVSAMNENKLNFTTKKVTINHMENILTNNGWQPTNSCFFNTKKVTIGQMTSMLRNQGWR